ncbi:aldehyde dehydrogenase [Planomonospora venezuelensis]|uniref:Aldehyde dehydrogenase (NAD+) n=1 Tax=Planomonospora venezuelensis TaxID=1999 RepID=A0A841CZJ4_PLAVE|nr:aldehyde dehydrogenase [Planomonospora venezuelensis]MBB5961528.1 aldehyde dehydrogenase (NAD+) [Planomonospora venezuelensis]GIM98672.1 aldehyde dehydrogenase [Planomonospora venezuelensis]
MLGNSSPLLIDGGLLPGRHRFETVDPATEEVLGEAADATREDMDHAIAAARRAFDDSGWATDPALRVRCLRQLSEALTRHAGELRELTVAEAGAPRFLTYGAQLDAPVADLAWFAGLAERYAWEHDLGRASPMGMASDRRVVREPVGVVGAITPWNFPHQINLAKLGPALAAGNTVVLKPAPDTPWCAAALGVVVAEETDIPPGVVNVVTGADHVLGAMLSADPRVDLVSFTGSTQTGRAVMREAAETLKRVFLELGGKSAFIVLDDADLRGACSYAAFTAVTHAGQGCAITTRLLVPRARYGEAVEITAAAMAKLGTGDPRDDRTVCGPVISARQRERIEGYLDLARSEGGSFATGGGRPPGRDKGFWIEPTLVTGLTNDSRTAREEIFGPVLVIMPHDGDDDAVRIANDSPYGLSGAVHGGDPERARAVARRLRTGTVSVNGGVWYGADVPFGGYKQSGIGREMGVAGFEEYLETKAIAEIAPAGGAGARTGKGTGDAGRAAAAGEGAV